MKQHSILFFTVLSMILAHSYTWTDVTIYIEPDTLRSGSTGKVTFREYGYIEVPVTCTAETNDTVIISLDDEVVFAGSENLRTQLNCKNALPVAGVQTEVLFDTTCFSITTVERTVCTDRLSFFGYSTIAGGIRIYAHSLEARIYPGEGPIATIIFDTENCPEGQYQWNITNTIAWDDLSSNFDVKELDGVLTVFNGQRGDIDGNGHINVIDVFWGIRFVLGELREPTPRELEAADCNDDGEIDITDVIGIVNIVLGLDTCP